MAIVYLDKTLDVSRSNLAVKIVAKQNDVDSRYLRITMTAEGQKIDLAGFSSAQISVKRADGLSESFVGAIVEEFVIVPIPSWALEVEGYGMADVSLLDEEGRILTATSFRLYVERSSYSGDVSEDDPNYTVVQQLQRDVAELKDESGNLAKKDLSNVDNETFKSKAEEAGVGGGGSDAELAGEGCGKKIGYTEGCDYIVTSASSALAVFQTAVAEANDGDILYIMPGYYGDSWGSTIQTWSINKNLTFVGVGMPTLHFKPVTICTGGYNGETGEFDYGETYTTNWYGIYFAKGFAVQGEDGPGEATNSYAKCSDCIFKSDISIVGTYTNCYFKATSIITTGFYYGSGSYLYNCVVYCSSFYAGNLSAYGCDIHFSGEIYSPWGGDGSYNECSISFYGEGGYDFSNSHAVSMPFTNCKFYGYPASDTSYATFTNCYQCEGTAL